jgi:hypothetical protein
MCAVTGIDINFLHHLPFGQVRLDLISLVRMENVVVRNYECYQVREMTNSLQHVQW